ncbi:hypothetical protein LSH36_184g01078 [Paralvinella palmiformis]|uniref:Uncharacterized protein n=1 Tax=Paralvinella palmiformis TaxID=53620 RepID=A0AAD9JRT2_9ANNE|nr:hypothetical protein LSH36_184g01078 [Paralvinella palmiformis]
MFVSGRLPREHARTKITTIGPLSGVLRSVSIEVIPRNKSFTTDPTRKGVYPKMDSSYMSGKVSVKSRTFKVRIASSTLSTGEICQHPTRKYVIHNDDDHHTLSPNSSAQKTNQHLYVMVSSHKNTVIDGSDRASWTRKHKIPPE